MTDYIEELFEKLYTLSPNKPVYIVGGWLRDLLLKRPNRDLDLVVADRPLSLARKIAVTFKGRVVVLDETRKIYRVVLKENSILDYIDIACMRGKDITSDLSKRDFTVNAMAVGVPRTGKLDIAGLIDPLGGMKDLRSKTMRMASRTAFKDDPLRLMRAFRLSSELGFSIAPATRSAIRKYASLLIQSAAERARDELFRIFSFENTTEIVMLMDDARIFETLIPEISLMKKSARKFYFHPRGLWQHSLETLSSLENILSKLEDFVPGNENELKRHLDEVISSGVTRTSLLKFVALLHDMGKPYCARRVGKKMRFLGHETKGAAMAAAILQRLRAGKKEGRIARSLIEHHMRPISLSQAPKITERATYRLFRDIGENVPDLLLLSLADCYSYQRLKGKVKLNLQTQRCSVKSLIHAFYQERSKPASPRIIDGNDIMREFKLKPGPLIGALLKELLEAQQLEIITGRKEAFAFAKKRLTVLRKKYKIN